MKKRGLKRGLNRAWKKVEVIAVALGLVVLVGGCRPEVVESPSTGGSGFLEYLSGTDSKGFDRVIGPRPLEFPRDHGEHPDYQIEWWYFTGNLDSDEGRHLGFELTFFRFGLSGPVPDRESSWATRQLYLAHFAITDVEASTFHAAELRNRGALDVAGVQLAPWKAWNGGWSATSQQRDTLFPLELRAKDGEHSLNLRLEAVKARVDQGVDGYSRKGDEPGNASHYYSYPRLAVTGSVGLPGSTHEVQGLAWMDHEWSTSVLGEGVAGWDWFAIHLDDGSELMAYHLRRKDGTIGEWSQGTHVARDGTVTKLSRSQFILESQKLWESPVTEARYPAAWRLRVPELGLDLEIEVATPDQELRLSTVYWEGAIIVRGTNSGRGYAELVGYAPGR